jgi:hypothetical protein
MLPDVALLEIFEFYMDNDAEEDEHIEAWHTLVHVCRKWRNVIFGSPRRLNLRLHCKARTPVRETLDVWPPLPIVICLRNYETSDMDNTIAALEHNDRIHELDLFYISSSQIMEKVLAAMQRPFPALTCLRLGFVDQSSLVVPASFLGGSAPVLQTLSLDLIIPFPGLPELLLSATHLVQLTLNHHLPHSGYISPEAMVTCLSVLTRLESLSIGFESLQSRPDPETRLPPPRTCTLLPVLTQLSFYGASEYLEGLVAPIDAPLLDCLEITFHQPIFDSPQLAQFISRTPLFKGHDEARVEFSNEDVWITLDGAIVLGITGYEEDWQLSSLAQVYGSSFPRALIRTVKRLYILKNDRLLLPWEDDVESGQWLELFHLFTAVTDLYLSSEVTEYTTPALQELVGERVTEVLPSLQTIFFEEETLRFDREAIGQFVAARQLASRPLAVSRWEREDEESSDETDDESSYETDDE